MFQILIASMAMEVGHQNGVTNIALSSLHMWSNIIIDKMVFDDKNLKSGAVSANCG